MRHEWTIPVERGKLKRAVRKRIQHHRAAVEQYSADLEELACRDAPRDGELAVKLSALRRGHLVFLAQYELYGRMIDARADDQNLVLLTADDLAFFENDQLVEGEDE